MGMKLHRNRRTMFQRRNRVLTIVLSILSALAVISIGFFSAKFLNERPQTQPDAGQTPTASAPAESQTTLPVQTQPESTDSAIKGIYLPLSSLQEETTRLGLLEQAAAAGFNSVIFDLKGEDGTLYYRFTSNQAVQVNRYAGNALSAEDLAGLFAAIRQAGLQPIPRLYAFRDHAAAKMLTGARITITGNSGWVWYDNDPANGGRAWLNPYADEAQQYILALSRELQQAGAAAILLDGVEFPAQTQSANFGNSSNTSMSRNEILTAFVQKVRTALSNCPIILSSTCQGALGINTTIYGNNPLTFAPHIAAPFILPGKLDATIRVGETTIANTQDNPEKTVQALVEQMVLRTKVMQADTRPTLCPWLQAEGYSPQQIRQEITGCKAGGVSSFILYHSKGQYDFHSLKGAF